MDRLGWFTPPFGWPTNRSPPPMKKSRSSVSLTGAASRCVREASVSPTPRKRSSQERNENHQWPDAWCAICDALELPLSADVQRAYRTRPAILRLSSTVTISHLGNGSVWALDIVEGQTPLVGLSS